VSAPGPCEARGRCFAFEAPPQQLSLSCKRLISYFQGSGQSATAMASGPPVPPDCEGEAEVPTSCA